MSDMLRLLMRMFAIAFGFFAGCLAAGLAYAFLARLVVPEDFGRFSDLELTVTLVVGVVGVASLFARAVLIPAFAIIAIFEFLRRRDWLSYALAGAVLALASGVYLAGGTTAEPAQIIAIHTACAIIGASVYWLVTGRNAGRWLPSERARTATAVDGEA
ncbi:MAG: hypothetical protein KUA43_17010 [Hoeflea sp.]|uniref:hypothetical protein n=1 Tax=Hoeflea sp. TaxID=1940281 RepID=UPI001D6437C4|nr:hypothetical protein [Hoeflea sp.]MBU4531864.1 hypothetical protein [Alphaproteobacteria bacterium]MBU4544720.1 hypothetical protein [Alphaproteobacteria bacterium]MBU4552951.1 hypothetical protein [Alphaproteobacteria bacterium]MBV1725140.1 hypothetical protein [Hoeflea sp.]MBV1761160.1 hypothetical protein [Hoeflea sp.]